MIISHVVNGIAVIILIFGVFVLSAKAETTFVSTLVNAAIESTKQNITYDGSYYQIKYPGGDVPENVGVCSDVLVRSYRAVGIDLQKLVHEDMKLNFNSYPNNWGLNKPDSNIDHRRVPNLQVFFSRHGELLDVSKDPGLYEAGDIVTWNLIPGGDLPHIGIVSNIKSQSGIRYIIHNIGEGPKLEDILFDHKITGHYRYIGK